MADLLLPDDPLVTGASIWPIRSLFREVADNAALSGTLDGEPFWSDGFYMERGLPPVGTIPHPRQKQPFAQKSADACAGGVYVPVAIGPYLFEEADVPTIEDEPEPEPWVAVVMVHANTKAPIVAIQAKYLNRIRTCAVDPVFTGAHSFGRNHWPLVVHDGGRLFALVMGIQLNFGDLEGMVADAERAERGVL
jgi:hypothetical protein